MTQGERRISALDGVRAVAILAVIANHTGVSVAQGGYLGVDVFFVLSGYLITGILLRERERHGQIRLGLFYARRALRLWPALILAVGFAGLLVATGRVAEPAFGAHAVVAVLYLQDLANAFGLGPAMGPLNTTWSLAIEEHFYLLWPLVLVLAARWGRRGILIASLTLAAVSFTLMQVGFAPFPPPTAPVYYHPEARAVALLIGCAAAALPVRGVDRRLAAPALLLIVVTMLLSPPANVAVVFGVSMPLVWLGTGVLLLAVHRQPTVITPLLAWRPLVWIGAVSYGLYLFHPLTFQLANGLSHRRSVVVAVGTALAFALATASFYTVERYFNRLKDRVFQPGAAAAPSAAAPAAVEVTAVAPTSGGAWPAA